MWESDSSTPHDWWKRDHSPSQGLKVQEADTILSERMTKRCQKTVTGRSLGLHRKKVASGYSQGSKHLPSFCHSSMSCSCSPLFQTRGRPEVRRTCECILEGVPASVQGRKEQSWWRRTREADGRVRAGQPHTCWGKGFFSLFCSQLICVQEFFNNYIIFPSSIPLFVSTECFIKMSYKRLPMVTTLLP